MQFTLKLLFLVAFIKLIHLQRVRSVEPPPSEDVTYNSTEGGNDTVPRDLYVIKTVVYEVGILTEADNDTDNLNQTHEQVDIKLYDPTYNKSGIDLSNIPVPIQANVSGVSVTGILPGADLSSVLLPGGNPVLPNKQVTVTQNISTTNPDEGSTIISNLPKILGLTTNSTSTNKQRN